MLTNRGEIYEEEVYFMRFFNQVHNVVDHNFVNCSFFHYLCNLIK